MAFMHEMPPTEVCIVMIVIVVNAMKGYRGYFLFHYFDEEKINRKRRIIMRFVISVYLSIFFFTFYFLHIFYEFISADLRLVSIQSMNVYCNAYI